MIYGGTKPGCRLEDEKMRAGLSRKRNSSGKSLLIGKDVDLLPDNRPEKAIMTEKKSGMRKDDYESNLIGPSAGFKEEDEGELMSQQAKKQFNMKATITGEIVVHRAPIVRFLKVPSTATCQPFKLPVPEGWKMPPSEIGLGGPNKALQKRLGMRGKMAGIVLGGPRIPILRTIQDGQEDLRSADFDDDDVEDALSKAYKENPLVLFEDAVENHSVTVEAVIGKYLREHQREGLQFLFECVSGLRSFDGKGCILADDMGLGKTLQSVCLAYTVLRQGLRKGEPLARRVLVVTPTSLVRNWDNEFDKWLKGKVKCLAVTESSRSQVQKQIRAFTSSRMYDVCIISYDTYRLNQKLFSSPDAADLLICDEAHRLKNDQTQTSISLDALHTKRRILLSGTPLQNDLEEFFAMVNFCNPNVLGTVSSFRKRYQNPILIGREPDATDEEQKQGEARSAELSDIVNQFILRRTNSLLSKHLPPKLTQIVCIKLTDMQIRMYKHMIYAKLLADQEEKRKSASPTSNAQNDGKSRPVPPRCLALINELKKLCNHPMLLFQKQSKYCSTSVPTSKKAYGLESINNFFPEGFDGSNSGYRNSSRKCISSGSSGSLSNYEWSGKFVVVHRLLFLMRRYTEERIVIVSNYTQTLDLLEILCKEFNYPFVRLDGSASAKKRQAMVDRLNDPSEDVFVFLLSSKAGGCGLNLIGANRLILFDPDWNPATDKQAAARVWRDGQKKRTYVYRFVATGSIEEKVFQRQLSKEGLQSVIEDDQSLESAIGINDLKNLFSLEENTISDTHDKYKCSVCRLDGRQLPTLEPINSQTLDEKNGSGTDSESAVLMESKLGATGRRPLSRLKFSSKANRAPKQRAKFLDSQSTAKPDSEQVGLPNEGSLCEWSHHYGCESVDDPMLKIAGRGLVSFVFGQAIDSKSLALKAEKDASEVENASNKKESHELLSEELSKTQTHGPNHATCSPDTPMCFQQHVDHDIANQNENERITENQTVI